MLPDIIHSTRLNNEAAQKEQFKAGDGERKWTRIPGTGRAAFFSF
jgi:hypothetical protein